MSNNPLFPTTDTSKDGQREDPAVQLIRDKVARVYSGEPDAAQELAEAKAQRTPSKHQRYMQELSSSGKSLAEIQTAWHHYYTTLPDAEKHEVWQEFYDANQHTPYQKLFQKQQATASRKANEATEPRQPAAAAPQLAPNGVVVATHEPAGSSWNYPHPNTTTTGKLKNQIAKKVSANGKLKVRHHVQSLLFGLASGFVVLVILLFSFFNEYIIAPFIQPSRTVSATPIILGDTTAAQNVPPSVTVPKINIQIPVNFSLTTDDEAAVEDGLKSGVVHYPSTVLPGQNGNAAFFGHSSQNIFNNGKYKFAFTLLHEVTTGDLFYITYNGTTYAYQVFAREIVPPSDVGVLNDTKGKQATAVLITCDPPGFSTNRLVLWGEQISPNPATNTAGTPAVTGEAPTQLASNGPTLWTRLVRDLEFWK